MVRSARACREVWSNGQPLMVDSQLDSEVGPHLKRQCQWQLRQWEQHFQQQLQAATAHKLDEPQATRGYSDEGPAALGAPMPALPPPSAPTAPSGSGGYARSRAASAGRQQHAGASSDNSAAPPPPGLAAVPCAPGLGGERSIGHGEANCKPCLFNHKGVCKKERGCQYCHLPHTTSQIRRVHPSKVTRRCLRLRAQENTPEDDVRPFVYTPMSEANVPFDGAPGNGGDWHVVRL